MKKMEQTSKRILFFDGVCHLCNGLVDFSLPKFKAGEIYFAPLQGPTAESLLTPQDLGLEYVAYFRDGIVYRKSKAIAYLLQDMGGMYRIPSVMLHIIPSFISDFFYKIVAKFRYRLFGKDEMCRIPTPEERKYFLD